MTLNSLARFFGRIMHCYVLFCLMTYNQEHGTTGRIAFCFSKRLHSILYWFALSFSFLSSFFLRSIFLSRFVLFWLDLHLMKPTQKKKTAFLWWLFYDWWCAWLIIRSVCVCFLFVFHFSLLSSCFLFSLFLLYSTLRATGKTWYSLYRSVWDMALFCHIFSVRLPTDLSICLVLSLAYVWPAWEDYDDWLIDDVYTVDSCVWSRSFFWIYFLCSCYIYDLFRFRYLGFTVFQLQNLLFLLSILFPDIVLVSFRGAPYERLD